MTTSSNVRPQTELRLTNSYGDVYIGDETPELTLRLSNGALDAAAVREARLLELTFCKANIRSIGSRKDNAFIQRIEGNGDGKDQHRHQPPQRRGLTDAGQLTSTQSVITFSFGSAEVITGTSYFSDIIADRR
ncbi:MAG: hypothetical protein MZU84_02465 [Sphingobacterium sp.]|nr:hypothetical protein [Sphingobacterium sp.]